MSAPEREALAADVGSDTGSDDQSRRRRWFGGRRLSDGARIYWWREILISR